MNRKSIFTLVLSLTFVIGISSGYAGGKSNSSAQSCRVVKGNIIEFRTSGDDPILTTEGRVTGSLVGRYKFTLTGGTPTDPIPQVLFFSGESSIQTKEGKLKLIELGALDTRRPGNFSDLATITGGTRAFKNASGQIHTLGHFDGTTGVGNFKYKGTLCVPLD